MKAYAYAEAHSRTAHSVQPVTYYVLRYSCFSKPLGIGRVITLTPAIYELELEERSAEGVAIITSRLPFFTRAQEFVCVDEEVSEPFVAKITRVPISSLDSLISRK